jgi:hypothetical protein
MAGVLSPKATTMTLFVAPFRVATQNGATKLRESQKKT